MSRVGLGKWGFNQVTGNLKVLGVHMGIEEVRATRCNWDMVISRVKSTVNRWWSRDLSLRGKVTVWNALVASQIIHVLGTCVQPDWALKSLKEVLLSFLWRGRGNSIALQVLTARPREGGA